MCKTKVIAGVLIVIAFVGRGLPAGVQAEGDDEGLVASDLWRKRI
uniref:Uncharacterized protein n=1 Tax=Candidatus Methanogaster sp. ANME-2c ERB4 TaxID=2759911 RepID=A0A7G9Y1Q1_9EURY|nr:hypothetical protein EMGBPPAD_00003 [Methanosarcinales archaeon ANME-2c ERB4]